VSHRLVLSRAELACVRLSIRCRQRLAIVGAQEDDVEITNPFGKEVPMATPSTSNRQKTQQNDRAKLDEKIRRRAYDFYEQRGRRNGQELDDWLQAEAEVTGTKKKTNAP
jgi:hypothetical protein